MENDDWRARLQEAIDQDPRSAREISLSMGRGPGYLHGLLKNDKEPTLPNVVAICKELKISVQWFLFGIEMDANTEELLKIYSGLPEEERQKFMGMAQLLSPKGS